MGTTFTGLHSSEAQLKDRFDTDVFCTNAFSKDPTLATTYKDMNHVSCALIRANAVNPKASYCCVFSSQNTGDYSIQECQIFEWWQKIMFTIFLLFWCQLYKVFGIAGKTRKFQKYYTFLYIIILKHSWIDRLQQTTSMALWSYISFFTHCKCTYKCI